MSRPGAIRTPGPAMSSSRRRRLQHHARDRAHWPHRLHQTGDSRIASPRPVPQRNTRGARYGTTLGFARPLLARCINNVMLIELVDFSWANGLVPEQRFERLERESASGPALLGARLPPAGCPPARLGLFPGVKILSTDMLTFWRRPSAELGVLRLKARCRGPANRARFSASPRNEEVDRSSRSSPVELAWRPYRWCRALQRRGRRGNGSRRTTRKQ